MEANVVAYDCLVLSGGGAKGSYGAGVAKALEVYRANKAPNRKICYLGTSAGALNAAVLASKGADALIEFWKNTTKKRILGFGNGWRKRLLWKLATQVVKKNQPFFLYNNLGLKGLVEESISFDEIKSDLIVLAVNFDRGCVTAFYKSSLINNFVETDRGYPLDKQRMQYYKNITDQEMLINSLLASSAIPLAFPPILIDGELHVDGGIGNNIPTKEAAWFLRHAAKNNDFLPGHVYCVKLDPPGIRNTDSPMGPKGILLRTWDISYHLRMKPVLEAWHRINNEVSEHAQKCNEVLDAFKHRYNAYPSYFTNDISFMIDKHLRPMGGKAQRIVTDLVEFEPSNSLGSTLHFDPKNAVDNIKRGFIDGLTVLMHRGQINNSEFAMWIDDGPFHT